MAINPCGHRVLVLPDKVDNELTFGESKFIIVTDTKLEQAGQQFGTVVKVGPQAWKAFGKDFAGEPWAKEGDKVIFPRYAGVAVDMDGDQYRLMNDDDILAVIV